MRVLLKQRGKVQVLILTVLLELPDDRLGLRMGGREAANERAVIDCV
jgi:hypothetical protein